MEIKCLISQDRLLLANKWLEKIRESYTINDDIIESYTEYFLIICNSIFDYVIVDFLDTLHPKIKMIDKFNMAQWKNDYIEKRHQICHAESEKILDFLKDHKTELNSFKSDLAVKYFIMLRNLTVHSLFPHIYHNQQDDEHKIILRRFHRNFVSYLLKEDGGKLLYQTGFPIELNKNNEGSFFDKYPLSTLDQTKRSTLETILQETDPLELMGAYFKNIEKFVDNFERKY